MAASNSNRLLLIGVLVFVVGIVLVLLVFWGLSNDDEPTTVVTESPTTGTQQPDPQPTFTGPIQKLPVPMEVPENMEGVAISMEAVRGLIATPIPGDLVNIYQLQNVSTFLLQDPLNPVSPPILPNSASLLLREIEVLGIVGSSTAESVTFIIAVEPGDVGELLPLIEAEQLWFTLLPQPEEPVEEATTEAAA